MRPLSPHALAAEGYVNARYRVVLEDGVAYRDLFCPQFWAEHIRKLVRFDIVRVIAADESFDVGLTVSSITDLGVQMRVMDKHPADASTEPSRFNPDEVRIEYLPAIKWRLFGFGNVEIKRGMTKPEAEAALAEYIEQSGIDHGLLIDE
jgi:hypothetical protein